MDERNYWLALAKIPQIGTVRFKLLIDHFGSAEEVWSLTSEQLKETGMPTNVVSDWEEAKREVDQEILAADFASKNINFVCQFEDTFPLLLKEWTYTQ